MSFRKVIAYIGGGMEESTKMTMGEDDKRADESQTEQGRRRTTQSSEDKLIGTIK